MLKVYLISVSKIQCVLHCILQLAKVPRPRVSHKRIHDCRMDAANRCVAYLIQRQKEPFDKLRDITPSLLRGGMFIEMTLSL